MRPAHAAGFALASQGAASLGLSGSATARTDLPDAGFYNPAALAWHQGLQLTLGGTLVSPDVRHTFTDGTETTANTGLSVPPHLYAAYGFGDLAVGVSAGIPFGSGVHWPTDESWIGRFDITDVALKTYEFAGNVAYAPFDGLAFAVGPRVLFGTVQFERQVDAVSQEGHVAIAGAGGGVAGQAAVAYTGVRNLQIGLSYRSRVRLGFTGSAHFEDIPIEIAAKAHDGPVTSEMVLPDRLAFGAAYRLGAGTLSADIESYLWSTVQALEIDFADEATPDVNLPRNWRSTVAVRAGYEHRVPVEGLVLRTGMAYDPAPGPADTLSPSSPDGNRVLLSLGASYAVAPLAMSVHAGYAHVFVLESTASGDEVLAGSYAARADLFSLSLAYGI